MSPHIEALRYALEKHRDSLPGTSSVLAENLLRILDTTLAGTADDPAPSGMPNLVDVIVAYQQMREAVVAAESKPRPLPFADRVGRAMAAREEFEAGISPAKRRIRRSWSVVVSGTGIHTQVQCHRDTEQEAREEADHLQAKSDKDGLGYIYTVEAPRSPR